jgi:NAD kinase
MIDRIVVVVKKTPQEELVERVGTKAQARFLLRQEKARLAPQGIQGPDFEAYDTEDATYQSALAALRRVLPQHVRTQFIEKSFLPSFSFGERELVVVLGPDGLVVNTAKYLAGQPIFALNPDPTRIEGILLPFNLDHLQSEWLDRAVQGRLRTRSLTMAEAVLADGQSLRAVNDLFIGRKSHASARYRLEWNGRGEDQSSSGIIVSTGAGSTGWLRSLAVGACGLSAAMQQAPAPDSEAVAMGARLDWEDCVLSFCVREPWPSRVTSARLLYGQVRPGVELTVISQMPQEGVIFSDGIENDFLEFNSGAVARIGVSDSHVNLLMPEPR